VSELAFVVPGPPQPKERPRIGKRGHVFTPHRTGRYEGVVRLHAQAAASRARWRPSKGTRYAVSILAVFGDARRRDLDNVCKSVTDALNGVAYLDDSEVDEVHMVRALDRARPRVEVRVTMLAPGLT
jgi:crossover junction endodeoxyribonuclease RusA